MSIVIAVIIFSLLIFIHELGHFLLAKKNGIRVVSRHRARRAKRAHGPCHRCPRQQ